MSRGPGFCRSLLVVVIVLLLSDALVGQRGAIVLPQNLSQITDRAARVIRGHISSVHVEPHPQYKNLRSVVVTVSVSETLKGSQADTYTFRQFLWDRQGVQNAAGYRLGQEVVLFMNPTSDIGFSSPVGIEEGRFRVEKDATGTLVAVNAHSNLTLMQGMSDIGVKMKLSARARQSIVSVTASGGPIPVDVLEETVRALVSAKRSN